MSSSNHVFRTHIRKSDSVAPNERSYSANTSRPWFYANELATIYQFPTPSSTDRPVVGVVSFGGGLYGNVDSKGILTNGDCQQYWSLCGIPSSNFPTVVVKTLPGAFNRPIDPGTDENTLDVETIGAVCPTSNLTIILYIATNALDNFAVIMDEMLNKTVNVRGSNVKPTIVSASWGATEVYFTPTLLSNTNLRFQTAVSRGINIACSTGDYGSSDGYGPPNSSYANFPSSSPNVIACCGTNLYCPNRVYDNSTGEIAWPYTGGAGSRYFSKPSYQVGKVVGSNRRNADVASVADPATGVLYIVNGQQVIYGGTSVSAPTVAGYLATFNCSNWVNPILYGSPLSNFHDITSGDNGAYNAGVGWDNVTGLGSLKGTQLVSLLTNPPGPISVSGVSVLPTSATVNIKKTLQLAATVNPLDSTNRIVLWSTSNFAIATVNSKGLVTAKANGTCTITVTTQDGAFTATSEITVRTPVTSISITPRTATVKVGRTFGVTVTFKPSTSTNTNYTITSSNPAIASVSGTTVTGVARGRANIVVVSQDGLFRTSCAVTVTL